MDPLLLAYFSLTAALVITPGATTAVVVRNTLAGGAPAGLAAAVGAAAGNTTHATAAGLGLAVLVSRIPALLLAVQVGGGLYLGWLGLASLRRVVQRADPPPTPAFGAWQPSVAHHAVREGLVVNLMNPAIATFYLVVVPSFTTSAAPRGYYTLLAATHVLKAFVCHAAWAIALDRLRHVLADPRARRGLEALTAAALLLLAARVLLAIRP